MVHAALWGLGKRVPRWMRGALCTAVTVLSGSLVLAQDSVVGRIPAEFSVSPGGAATYRIPIQVPPGIAGMAPKLAMVYNSQAGNGIIGMGWGLDGLSSITRCPKTMATDGARGVVTHTPEDRFCMDGQRLINVAGSYGAAGSEYRTEIESFSKIIAIGAASGDPVNGPQSFIVKTKAGLTLEYGGTEDSRIEAQGKSLVRLWAISRMLDVAGNEIRYAYSEDRAKGEFNIYSIDYPAGGRVVFGYQSRPDSVEAWEAGSKSVGSFRLGEIHVAIGANKYSTYKVGYAPRSDGQVSRPQSFQMCSSEGRCFPSIQVVNQPSFPDAGWLSVSNGDWGYTDRRWWVDTNGDGLLDYCYAAGNSGGAGGLLKCRPSTGSGLGAEIVTSMDDWGYEGRRWWVDINGDGRQDYCYAGGNASGPGSFLNCRISNGSGLGEMISTAMPDWGHEDRRWWIDINGDGRQDYCFAAGDDSGAGSYLKCRISDGAKFDMEISVVNKDWGYADRRWWVDVNGDGLQDYCYAAGSGSGEGSYLKCRISNGAGFGSEVAALIDDWGYADRRWWVDVNGDGRQDYCSAVGNGTGAGSYMKCRLSTGTGFSEATLTAMEDWGYEDRRWWVDVNGDGRLDYCFAAGSSEGAGSFLKCRLSDGVRFDTETITVIKDWGYSGRRWWVDINGDGRLDYCYAGGADSGEGAQLNCLTKIAPASDNGAHVVSISNAGLVVQFSYQSIASPNAGYLKDGEASYPIFGVGSPLWVVSSVSQDNGVLGSNTTSYLYGGLKAEHASAAYPGSGRGMLGFKWMISREQATGIVNYTEYAQRWPYTGQVVRSETRLIGISSSDFLDARNGLYKISEIDWIRQAQNTLGCYQTEGVAGGAKPNAPTTGCDAWAAGKVYFPFVMKSLERSRDANGSEMPSILTTTEYGGYADQGGSSRQLGDPTKIVVEINQGDTVKHRKIVVNQYRAAKGDGWDWQSGRLDRSIVTSSWY